MTSQLWSKATATLFAAALCAAAQAAPLTLDTAALTNAWEEAGISAYKCRIAFRNFGKEVADANAEAAAKRTQLDTTARVYLKSQMEKAQAEGDLDKVLVFRRALESARGGAITGDDEAVAKLRESYDRQLALADKTLLDAGLAAARAFAASLDEQKKEATKKGDIDDAQKIAAFQKKVGEWMKALQGQATQTVAERPAATPRPKPQPRPPVREAKLIGAASRRKLFCVIDLSAGPLASSYSVTYLATPPNGGFNVDEYKTTKLVLRRIEPGTFIMCGQYQTTLTKPFYIGVFEVTQKQYELVMGINPSNFTGGKRPVENVSYSMVRGATIGSNWPASSAVDPDSLVGKLRTRTNLDFDMPTEAQWEYACRAGTTSKYYNGDSANGSYMWYDSNSSSQTHEVGTTQPNGWGLYDMHGNVWEWCLDWYGTLSDGVDPKGASQDEHSVEPYRVVRGGSWFFQAYRCASFYRGRYTPSDAHNHNDSGIRLVIVLNE